jgi:hypothetical protein
MTNWKNLERKTAKVLNGRRNSRGNNFSQPASDVSQGNLLLSSLRTFKAFLER